MHWTGKQWERDDNAIMLAAMDFAKKMLEEAHANYLDVMATYNTAKIAKELDDEIKEKEEAATKYANHAHRLRGLKQLQNMVTLSSSKLKKKATVLDDNPYILNTPGGMIDLRSGETLPHDKLMYCEKMTAVAPSLDGMEMWMDFVNRVTGGDKDFAVFLQEVCGMALFGKVFSEMIVISEGSGRNGKSTMFNSIAAVLGDYSGAIDVSILTTDRQNRGASMATLRKKRFVLAGEMEENQRLSVATIKKLCSTDEYVAEEKYKAPVKVKPTHSLFLFTNFLPKVGSTDPGTWRRLCILPFHASIAKDDTIQNYSDVLIEKCGGAILHWAISGALLYWFNDCKITPCSVVTEATKNYRNRENWVSNFLHECCVEVPGDRIASSSLYAEYRRWSQETGEYIRRQAEFNEAIENAGYKRRILDGRKYIEGLKLQIGRV